MKTELCILLKEKRNRRIGKTTTAKTEQETVALNVEGTQLKTLSVNPEIL